MKYPQYRKYPNNKSFFKIVSAEEFEEILVLGDIHTLHVFNVKILPDRNFIYDMTFDYKNNWAEISESEYQVKRMKI